LFSDFSADSVLRLKYLEPQDTIIYSLILWASAPEPFH